MGFLSGLKVLSMTDAAAERVREIVAGSDRPIAGLKVGVRNGGCAGMAYTFDLVETADPKDDVVEEKGATVYIDPKATLFLLGSVMDFRTTKLASTFVFENPNEVAACGCGESVSLKPAELPHAG